MLVTITPLIHGTVALGAPKTDPCATTFNWYFEVFTLIYEKESTIGTEMEQEITYNT